MVYLMMNQNINFSNNSSLVSALLCVSTCLVRRYNLKILKENFIKDNILDITNIFEKLSKISQKKQDEIDLANSIKNFINKAKLLNVPLKLIKIIHFNLFSFSSNI
jgi:hypothetical protein